MGFRDEDKNNEILIINCMTQKGTAPKKLIREFPEKGWRKSGLSCSVVQDRRGK